MQPHPDMPDAEYVTGRGFHPMATVGRIGGENSTVPAWYVVEPDDGFGMRCTARVTMTDKERAAIAAGADIDLTLYGGELPWSLSVIT